MTTQFAGAQTTFQQLKITRTDTHVNIKLIQTLTSLFKPLICKCNQTAGCSSLHSPQAEEIRKNYDQST